MRLRSFRVRRYRAFSKEVAFEVRPLTLLFGYNSAGKSALLRALPLVAESIRWSDGPLALTGDAARGASFGDLRSRWSAVGGPRIGFGLEWDDDTHVDVEIVHHASSQREVIDALQVRAPGGHSTTYESDLTDERAPDISPYRSGDERGIIEFAGWLPQRVEGFSSDTALSEAGRRLRDFSQSVHWLGSMRSQLPRSFELRGARYRLDVDGRGAGEILARDSLSTDRSILTRTDRWFREATRHEVQVREHGADTGRQYAIALRPLKAPDGIHISDTGEGMTQVLPVITLGALALAGKPGPAPLLALEQPELHLHPSVHANVANFLIDVSSKATVVVETHSENILLAVQVAIASGRLSPDDVVIHWVRSTEEGPSYVDTIHFDEKARPSAWPPDVFAEDQALKRRVIELRHEGRPQ